MRCKFLLVMLLMGGNLLGQESRKQVFMIKPDVSPQGSDLKLNLGVGVMMTGEKDNFYVTEVGLISKADAAPAEEAIKVFSERIAKNPTAVDYRWRAFIYEYLKKNRAAIRDYNEAIKLEPKNPEFYVFRITREMDLKDLDAVVADCNELMKLSPKSTFAKSMKDEVQKKRAEQDARIKEATKLVLKEPKSVINLQKRALLYIANEDYQKALADYNSALRIRPHLPELLRFRGFCNRLCGRYEQAIADYRESIQGEPDESDPYGGLSWLRSTCPEEKFRDGREALQMAEKAKVVWDSEQSSLDVLFAAAYAELGDWDKAVEWQIKAIKANQFSDKELLEEQLALYQQKQPYRTPPAKQPVSDEAKPATKKPNSKSTKLK